MTIAMRISMRGMRYKNMDKTHAQNDQRGWDRDQRMRAVTEDSCKRVHDGEGEGL